MWPEWHVARLIPGPATIFFDPTSPYYWPDPYWLDYPWMWPPQTLYCWIINNGTAGVFVRVKVRLLDTTTGWVQSGFTKGEYIEPMSEVVLEKKAGPVDLYYGLFWPWEDFQQYPSKWYALGELQISLEGVYWFDWDMIQPPLTGDPYDGTKFKLLPPA